LMKKGSLMPTFMRVIARDMPSDMITDMQIPLNAI
jgi:hypothetical protein